MVAETGSGVQGGAGDVPGLGGRRGLHPRLAALPAAGTGCDRGRHVPKRDPCWRVSRCDQDGMCCDAAESSLCPGAGPGEGKGDT